MAVIPRADDAFRHFLRGASPAEAGGLHARRKDGELPVGGIDPLPNRDVSEAPGAQDGNDLGRKARFRIPSVGRAKERGRSSGGRLNDPLIKGQFQILVETRKRNKSGWENEWFPISWPSRTIRAKRSGRASAFLPTTKKMRARDTA